MSLKKPKAMIPDLTSEVSLGLFRSDVLLIGVDEVGRGCLAGPVVAAAAALDPKRLRGPIIEPQSVFFEVRDSKMISERDRERIRDGLAGELLSYAVAQASVAEIAELNILYASHLAMVRAVEAVEANLGRRADAVLVDGNLVPKALKDRGQAIVKGDQKSISIACASILAKVFRDHLMADLDQKFPGYGLSGHKGYPTPFHKNQIRILGPSEIHRAGFKGVHS